MPVSLMQYHQGFEGFGVTGQRDLVFPNLPQCQTRSWLDSDNTDLLTEC